MKPNLLGILSSEMSNKAIRDELTKVVIKIHKLLVMRFDVPGIHSVYQTGINNPKITFH